MNIKELSLDELEKIKEIVPRLRDEIEREIKKRLEEIEREKIIEEHRILIDKVRDAVKEIEIPQGYKIVITDKKEINLIKDIKENQGFKDKSYSYIGWHRENSQIYAKGISHRTGKEYRHNCPVLHFQTIMSISLELYEKNNIINSFDIEMKLKNIDLGDGIIYREGLKYRIGVVLSILEQEGLIKWAEKRRPYRFFLERNENEIKEWFKNKIIEPWIKELYKLGNYKEILNLEKKILQNETIKGIILAAKAKIWGRQDYGT